MTDVTPPPAPDQLEAKLIGLERLRTAGLVKDAEYQRLRSKLLAGAPALTQTVNTAEPAPAACAAIAAAPARAPAFVLKPAASWAPRAPAPELAAPPPYVAPDMPVKFPGWLAVPGALPSESEPRSSRTALIALIAAFGLIAGGSVVYFASSRARNTSSGSTAAAPTPSSSATQTGAAAAHRTYTTIADFAPDAKAFVEQQRGLTWKSNVTVAGLDDAAFVAKLQGGRPVSNASASGDDVATRDLKALHIVPQGADLGSAGATATAGGVVGFYDNTTKALYVRGTTPTPYVREVIVHELTHALQDQWFGLGKLFATNDIGGESVEAFLAVVEGDAVRMERAYVSSLAADEQQQVQADSGGTAQQRQQLATVPPALLTLIGFPYSAGLRFDQALIDARGQSSLDAAFRTPPTTSAEILDPQRYLQDVHPVDVAFPSPAGAVYDRGVLGALGLVLLFDSLIPSGKMTQAQAVLTADAWGGDRYVAYSSGGHSCVRDTVSALTPSAQTVLDGALKQWIAATPGVTLTAGSLAGGGPVTFSACTG